MERKLQTSLEKWLLLFAVVFAMAMPISTKVTHAAAQYKVHVNSGYLALRSAKAYDSSNEKGKLYNGEIVELRDSSEGQYWWVYSAKLGMEGYVNSDYLDPVSSSNTWTVKVEKNYLALRSAKAFARENEIGKLYTGDKVDVIDSSDSAYWWVYSSKLDKYGYVNKDYLYKSEESKPSKDYSSYPAYTVSVNSGYLALRNARAYDSSNEIGKIYSGDTVRVIDTSYGQYWWVYSASCGKEGYVNSDYLYSKSAPAQEDYSSYPAYTVSVQSGYLALRNARAYDESNEIGELYSGETVRVLDTSYGQYWWVYSPKLGKKGYVNSDYLY